MLMARNYLVSWKRIMPIMATGLLILACYSVPKHDPGLLKQARDLKSESLSLMQKATEPYEIHEVEVNTLVDELNIALKKTKDRGGKISIQQWELLIDPEGESIGGFLNLWQKRSSFSEAFIEGKLKYIGDNFDQIIKLEEGLPR